MKDCRIYVNDELVSGRPPQGRRRAMVEIDEHGNVEVYLRINRPGRPREIPPEIRTRIANERAAGTTYAEIAQGLEEDGVPTPGGGRWATSTVQHVARQRKRDRAR